MINPRGLTLQEWADAVILVTDSSWSLGRLVDPLDWQIWAIGLVRAPEYAQRVVPDPYKFVDWREWAEEVYPLLEVNNGA
jgi:hypothetical protein